MRKKFTKINFNFNRKQQRMFVLMIVLFAGFLIGYINDSGEKEIIDVPLTEMIENVNVQKAENPTENKEVKTQVKRVESGYEKNSVLEYPFVDMQQQQSYGAANIPKTPPPASLPIIPHYSYSGQVEHPDIPLPKLPTTNREMRKDGIQGVLTGRTQNIAIMSNGRILKEGDQYMGSDIAYIDKNGITFSNGNQIAYQQKVK